ncbi:toxin-antitoxin system [Mycobacterium riyadhense]|uniref:toxin-antitoxin system n=1 Tax=Mycobacterium riyadhense TaxID=486698 RepID=UPI0019582A39|nr:toxin-antitoxin system [Mycobacterium riyadhense]
MNTTDQQQRRGRGRPPKGDRALVMTRLPRPVWEWVRAEATARHSSISQVVADLVSAATGHPDLVLELDKEVLPESA